MSTPIKWLVMLVLWFVFSFICYKGCVEPCCEGEAIAITEEQTTPPEVPAVTRYPLDFKWGDQTAYTNDGFDALRDRLVSEMTDDGKLVITGKYFASEDAPEGFSSMGMARATQARDLLAQFIDSDKMVLTDLKLDDRASARENFFESTDFEWQLPDREEQAEVIALDDNIQIRFPYSSAVKDPDPAVDEYLDKLAERLNATTERVQIVGHTDNTGSEAGNMSLSERRAKFIRDILVRKGVAANRLDIDWKGQTDPRSSNDTEEGRHNNRRVELKILSN